MKLLFLSSLAPVLGAAFLVANLGSPSEPAVQDSELPFLIYWSGEVRAELWSEWSAKRRESEFYIEDHHPKIYNETGYEEHLDQTGRVHQFGEIPASTTLDVVWNTYLGDPEWRTLDAEERDLLVDRAKLEVYLIPIAGRSPKGRMNVRYVQKMRARIGGLGHAKELARQLVQHVNANYDGMLARAYLQETGEGGWIWLLSDFSGLGAWQTHRTRLAGDTAYGGLFETGADAFVEGSFSSFLCTGI
jgi:hypothetical protein